MSDRNHFLSDSTDDATSSYTRYHPYRRQPPITCQHTHFYFPSGNFFVRIRGWLFRLHSEIILTPSSHIRSRFLSSQTEEHSRRGLTSQHPLCFTDIPEQDFELLLLFLYAPLDFERTTIRLQKLRDVATTLGYEEIRLIACHFLHRLSPGGSYPYTMRQIHDFSFSYPYLQQQMQRRRFEFRHPTEEIRQYINNLQDTADRSITRIQRSNFLHHRNI